MKKQIIKSVLAASMLFVTVAAWAQSASSAYFLEGFNQRYQLNPSFAPERKVFMAFPALSNIQLDASSTVGLANFLYESKSKPGMLTTFMSPDIDAETFLKALPKVAQFNVGFSMDVFALGIGGNRGYTTVNYKIRNQEQISLPKELFGFMKASLAQGEYLIENIDMNTITYTELSVSHSHKIGDFLTIGAGIKLLEGIEYVDLRVDKIEAKLGEEEWSVRSNGGIKASVPGTKFNVEEDPDTHRQRFDGFDDPKFGIPSSFGLAFDLGAEYDFRDMVKGLKVSAAITDLGFINWKNYYSFATDNDRWVDFEGFNNYDVNGDNSDDPMDQMSDDFNEMVQMYQVGGAGKESVGLAASFRLGAEYALPMANWVSFGELFTYRTGLWPYVESRTSVTLSPCGWFDLSGNMAITTLGSTLGFMLNLHPGGINFFLAVDRLKAEFNPQYIPLHDFGLDFSIGYKGTHIFND